MLQTKEQNKTSEKDLNETEITNLSVKKFKVNHKDAHQIHKEE